jgi:hypothetical protein
MKRTHTECLKSRSNSAEHACQRQVASLALFFVQVPAKWRLDRSPLLLASHQEECFEIHVLCMTLIFSLKESEGMYDPTFAPSATRSDIPFFSSNVR